MDTTLSKNKTNVDMATMAAAPVEVSISQTRTPNMITKTEFLVKIQDSLKEIYNNMCDFRNKTTTCTLTTEDMEDAFNNLYDAKDLLNFYFKQMKLQADDKFITKEKCWVQRFMEDLVEREIGQTAEVRNFKNEQGKSSNGTLVGTIDEVRVRTLTQEMQNAGVPLSNWMEIDRWFWTRDHSRELEDYKCRVRTPPATISTYRSYSSGDGYYNRTQYGRDEYDY
jgi:hypothetical protein